MSCALLGCRNRLVLSALLASAALVLGLSDAWAQSARSPQPTAAMGPYLGVLPAPVPEVLYEHVPALKRGQGVVVAEVLPGSPADKAKLQRHDILLTYDAAAIESCDHFARLLAADRPNRKVRLAVLRGGKEQTLELTLAQGPLLRPATEAAGPETPRGTAKQTHPGKVSVSASPLPDGGMVVTIEYYEEGSAKLKTVTCRGTAPEIDNEVNKLPNRVQDLTRAALERIRALEEKELTRSRDKK